MKFILFGFSGPNPKGGAKDIIGGFETLEDCMKFYEEKGKAQSHRYYQILRTEDMKVSTKACWFPKATAEFGEFEAVS